MKRFLFLLAFVLLTGCAPSLHTPPADTSRDFNEAQVAVKEKRYGDAVEAYKKIVNDASKSALTPEARYKIALIHAAPDNPQRDYARAAHEFEEFLKRYPDDQRATEAQNWIYIIKTVLELKKENEHLNNNIEELKQLDIRHEERRKGR